MPYYPCLLSQAQRSTQLITDMLESALHSSYSKETNLGAGHMGVEGGESMGRRTDMPWADLLKPMAMSRPC